MNIEPHLISQICTPYLTVIALEAIIIDQVLPVKQFRKAKHHFSLSTVALLCASHTEFL